MVATANSEASRKEANMNILKDIRCPKCGNASVAIERPDKMRAYELSSSCMCNNINCEFIGKLMDFIESDAGVMGWPGH